jgi:hypothetical protein
MMISSAQVSAARAELLSSSDAAIEHKTALAWTARAIAGYELARERRCLRWLVRATSYHHEATEHAAGVSSELVAQVEHALTVCKLQALHALGG